MTYMITRRFWVALDGGRVLAFSFEGCAPSIRAAYTESCQPSFRCYRSDLQEGRICARYTGDLHMATDRAALGGEIRSVRESDQVTSLGINPLSQLHLPTALRIMHLFCTLLIYSSSSNTPIRHDCVNKDQELCALSVANALRKHAVWGVRRPTKFSTTDKKRILRSASDAQSCTHSFRTDIARVLPRANPNKPRPQARGPLFGSPTV